MNCATRLFSAAILAAAAFAATPARATVIGPFELELVGAPMFNAYHSTQILSPGLSVTLDFQGFDLATSVGYTHTGITLVASDYGPFTYPVSYRYVSHGATTGTLSIGTWKFVGGVAQLVPLDFDVQGTLKEVGGALIYTPTLMRYDASAHEMFLDASTGSIHATIAPLTVPEPASLAVLLTGLTGIGMLRRQARRS